MNPQPQCVIHCRVSTGKQAYEGESLQAQAGICLDIATRNGWTVAHEPWLEAYSGRKAIRPAFEEVLAFLDGHPGAVRYYLFRAIDRFTRGGIVTYETMKQQLAKRGVELVDSMGVIQPKRNTLEHVGFEYDWSLVSPSEITEAVLATTAKAEATTILTRLIGQEISLTKQGYKIRQAVDGFKNERIHVAGKRRVIQVPDPERAKFYVAMFDLRAAGGLTDPQIVDRINAMGFRTPIRHRWDSSHQRVVGTRGGNPLCVKRSRKLSSAPSTAASSGRSGRTGFRSRPHTTASYPSTRTTRRTVNRRAKLTP
ncbi:MAG: recombinase family protein [Hyphomicrobium sp.]